MLRWCRRTYPSYNLQPLLLEALPRTGGSAGLQQLVGRAQAGAGGAAAPGRREPADGGRAPPGTPAALRAGRAPGRGTGGGRSCATVNEDTPGRTASTSARALSRWWATWSGTSRCWTSRTARPPCSSQATSTWDDFVQSSEDPNAQPLQHTPLQAIPEEGFRTSAEATDENVRLARRYPGYGGTRFVEDDLAGDPEAGALASNGQGPPSITDRLRHCRRRARGSGPHRRRGRGARNRALSCPRTQLSTCA